MNGARVAAMVGVIVALVGLAPGVAFAQSPPHQVVIETPGANATTGEPVWIAGWAVDGNVTTGTGVDRVYVYACPSSCTGSNLTYLGQAAYGGARPDIAAYLGDSRYTNSGYAYFVSGLTPGAWEFQVAAVTTGTNNPIWIARTATMVASTALAVESPVANASVAQPWTPSGWAVDFASGSGTGVDGVSLYSYLQPGSGASVQSVGAATYGNARTDLTTALQRTDSQFTPSGWTKSVSTMQAGEHLLIVYAHSTVTDGWVAVTRIIFVDAPQVALVVDRAGTGTGGVSASGLTCSGGSNTQGVPCQANYLQTNATSVTLTASADSGSTFTGWTGECGGTGTCTLTMSEPHYVGATFSGTQPAAYETRYYHLDSLGSVLAVTDNTSVVWATHNYGVFGEDTAALTGDPRRYTGNELDAETGLQYHSARYLRTSSARFGAVDPIGGSPEDPQSWNRYAYARNSPLVFVDPDGLLEDLPDDEPKPKQWNCGPNIDINLPVNCGSATIISVTPTGNGRNGVPYADWENWYFTSWGCGGCQGSASTASGGGVTGPKTSPINQLVGNIGRQAGPIVPVAGAAVVFVALASGAEIVASLAPETATAFRLVSQESRAGHIFREVVGHVNPATESSKGRFLDLFVDVARNAANYRPDIVPAAGIRASTWVARNGEQVWVYVRDSLVVAGGINLPGAHR